MGVGVSLLILLQHNAQEMVQVYRTPHDVSSGATSQSALLAWNNISVMCAKPALF